MLQEIASVTASKNTRIRDLNDRLRTTGLGGRVVVTAGIAAQPPEIGNAIYQALEQFSDFNADNDPHDEHDCATLEIGGLRIIWKIDYYDRQLEFASADPSDPKQTCRVLTIMLAEEY